MKSVIKITMRFVFAISICLAVTYCGYTSIVEREERKQFENRKTAQKNEQGLLEKAFASQYNADFIHCKYQWNHRILSCDLQDKIKATRPIAFFAFVDDVEKNGDEFVVHMTCPLTESCGSSQILFHLQADKDVVSAILNAKSTREKVIFKRLEGAPFLIVAQADKIVRAKEAECDEDEWCDEGNYDGYGKILDVKVRVTSLELS
jgi:hypothetical protein